MLRSGGPKKTLGPPPVIKICEWGPWVPNPQVLRVIIFTTVCFCIVLFCTELCCIVIRYCVALHCNCVVLQCTYCIARYCIAMYYIVLYFIPCLEEKCSQSVARIATGNMRWVVFHSTFPSLLARSSLLGSFWGLLKNQLRNFSTPVNHCEHFWSCPEIFRRFPNTSDDFQRFSENV